MDRGANPNPRIKFKQSASKLVRMGLGPCSTPLKFWRPSFNSFRVIRLFIETY